MRKYLIASCLIASGFFAKVQGQQEKWDLRKCVDYAVKNNISVKQADIQARITKITVEARKLAQYPTANANTQLGMAFGRSIDPTSNQFVTSQFLQNTYNINTNVQVFNWGSLKNSLSSAEFSAKAALIDVERTANDVSLSVATFYLQVLSAKQQISIAGVQIQQTKSQLEFTRKRVDAGALPELNAAELEAQLARDSVTLINTEANFQQAVLQLKAAINLDMSAPFELDTPPVDKIPVESIMELEPAGLYKLALTTQPQQKANDWRLKAAQKNIDVAKAALYPTISFGGGLGTNFANARQVITGATVSGFKSNGDIVNVSGTNYAVLTPNIQLQSGNRSFWEMWKGWGTQLDQNFRQNFGFFVSVPIFNGGTARQNIAQSKLQLQQQETVMVQANLTLQQNIYQAHATATAAMMRYNASKKTVATAEISYDYARKRYEAGLANTLDLITNQNNLLRAKLDMLNNQFDYVFRMKLLEFYKGQGLKL
jgi:outer membrane protein